MYSRIKGMYHIHVMKFDLQNANLKSVLVGLHRKIPEKIDTVIIATIIRVNMGNRDFWVRKSRPRKFGPKKSLTIQENSNNQEKHEYIRNAKHCE